MEKNKYRVLSCGKDEGMIRKTICAGFFMHAAKKDPNEGFRTILDNQ